MVSNRKSPAIFAGLVGVATFFVPLPAHALSLPIDVPFEFPFNFQDFIGSPTAYFVLGCVAGAALSGSIVMAVEKTRQDKLAQHIREGAQDARQLVRNAQLQEQREQDRQTQEEPTQHIEHGAAATEAATSQSVQVSAQAAAAQAAEPAEAAVAAQQAQQPRAAEPATQPQSTVVEAPQPQQPAMHPRPSASMLDALLPRIDGGLGTPAAASSASAQQAQAHGTAAAQHNAGVQPAPAQSAAAPRSTYAERQRNRRRGVRSLLTERLGSNMMDDIPVITRADGTVADIGTDWWDRTMGNTITRLSDVDDSKRLGMRPADETTDLEAAAVLSQAVRREERSRMLADRLPNFDRPLYPEQPQQAATATTAVSNQDNSASSDEDEFEQAMRAMEDRMPNRGVTTADDVAVTGVVPTVALDNFQSVGASAPTPSEAELSHVDDLVQQEVQRNRKDLPRRRRRSLRVVEGGGATERPASPDDTARMAHGSYRPKHMRRTAPQDDDTDGQGSSRGTMRA